MAKYRNITVFVEAEEYLGQSNKTTIITPWIADARRREILVFLPGKGNLHWNSPHGFVIIRIGDMIVKDAAGKIFTCSREIFDKTYEVAE